MSICRFASRNINHVTDYMMMNKPLIGGSGQSLDLTFPPSISMVVFFVHDAGAGRSTTKIPMDTAKFSRRQSRSPK